MPTIGPTSFSAEDNPTHPAIIVGSDPLGDSDDGTYVETFDSSDVTALFTSAGVGEVSSIVPSLRLQNFNDVPDMADALGNDRIRIDVWDSNDYYVAWFAGFPESDSIIERSAWPLDEYIEDPVTGEWWAYDGADVGPNPWPGMIAALAAGDLTINLTRVSDPIAGRRARGLRLHRLVLDVVIGDVTIPIRRPLRLFPRSDGLALSSARRVDANRSQQASLRRAGGTYI